MLSAGIRWAVVFVSSVILVSSRRSFVMWWRPPVVSSAAVPGAEVSAVCCD